MLESIDLDKTLTREEYVRDLIRFNLIRDNKTEHVIRVWRTLTLRQRYIAFLIYQGLSYQDIGNQLYLAENTISKIARDLMLLFGVHGKDNFRVLLSLLPDEYLHSVQDYETAA